LILSTSPGISQSHHAALLMVSTLTETLVLSAASFRLIEQPGMNIGRYLAKKLVG